MAWDRSTDPGFREHPDRMRAFARAEIRPLETLASTRRQAAGRELAAVRDAVTAND